VSCFAYENHQVQDALKKVEAEAISPYFCHWKFLLMMYDSHKVLFCRICVD